VSFDQDQDGVSVTFGDNTATRGDILVGADGAHSAVRNHLYKTLDKEGLLPKVDTLEMSKGYNSFSWKRTLSYAIIGDKTIPYTETSITLHPLFKPRALGGRFQ
jgi:2-polyprenyl-6-methoxyphenol hydroxylase-like FAD-dependent oxidoreductase